MGILIEQFAGKFPVWLSPCQVKVLPVSDKTLAYATEIAESLKAAGVRVKLDDRSEKIGYKIREAQQVDRVPYMLVLGEKEAESGNITVRNRDTGKSATISYEEFETSILSQIKNRDMTLGDFE